MGTVHTATVAERASNRRACCSDVCPVLACEALRIWSPCPDLAAISNPASQHYRPIFVNVPVTERSSVTSKALEDPGWQISGAEWLGPHRTGGSSCQKTYDSVACNCPLVCSKQKLLMADYLNPNLSTQSLPGEHAGSFQCSPSFQPDCHLTKQAPCKAHSLSSNKKIPGHLHQHLGRAVYKWCFCPWR